ncbi:MAG: hypothetical protein Q4C42_04875, partial [Clostridia bacterium]|nr:hypothetical protein [Clostridia bacterium]
MEDKEKETGLFGKIKSVSPIVIAVLVMFPLLYYRLSDGSPKLRIITVLIFMCTYSLTVFLDGKIQKSSL